MSADIPWKGAPHKVYIPYSTSDKSRFRVRLPHLRNSRLETKLVRAMGACYERPLCLCTLSVSLSVEIRI